MQQPSFVILAAGMGSRYGGLKQMDPIDPYGNLIIDYSIYDALRAGFHKIVFIIKHEMEEDFKKRIGNRMEQFADVRYAYQELDMLPDGFCVPENRVKPWGTAHALLCAKDVINEPFAVLNADDYYGAGAFDEVYRFLSQETAQIDAKLRYALVGYQIENTLTENGSVARGVCSVDEHGYLREIHERKHVERTSDGAVYSEDGGTTFHPIEPGSTVSMNLWGFDQSILTEIQNRFCAFLEKGLLENPLKCEYYLPEAVQTLLQEGKAEVQVLPSQEKWLGVTYQQDKPMVIEGLKRLRDQGVYPLRLWEA